MGPANLVNLLTRGSPLGVAGLAAGGREARVLEAVRRLATTQGQGGGVQVAFDTMLTMIQTIMVSVRECDWLAILMPPSLPLLRLPASVTPSPHPPSP